jgi:putative peptidoglycan lipid II flippase
MLVVPHMLTALVYERGHFLSHQVAPVAYALRAFGCGLPAYIGTKIFSSAFFAQGDTRTPIKVGLIAVFANISFIVLLAPSMGHVGVALSTALSSWINISVLYVLLRRKSPLSIFPKTRWRCGRQLISACFMAVVMYFVYNRIEAAFISGTLYDRIILFLLTMGLSFGTYGLLTYVLNALPALGSRPQE